MKTLLLYYSNNEAIRELCEESSRENMIDVAEIKSRYYRSRIWCATVGAYKAMSGAGDKIEDLQINMDEYDTIILASPVWKHNPAPAVNEFLHRNNLSGREVSCLIIHSGNSAGKAPDVLRKRIKLAGGLCRGVVDIPVKELKERNCDVCSYAGLKTQTA